METPYHISPEKWPSTPPVRGTNANGKPDGEDSGYRKLVTTLSDSGQQLVTPAGVIVRPSYDGVDELGVNRPEIALPGGTADKQLYVVESGARFLDQAQEVLNNVFAGQYQIAALDGFRSGQRQAEGFTRILRSLFVEKNIRKDSATVTELFKNGKLADGTFSWVNADTDDENYKTLATELKSDAVFMDELKALAAEAKPGEPLTEDDLDEALYEYITISANSNIGRAADKNVNMIFENNAHAGGAAIDMFLTDKTGRPLNIVPFDHVGEESGMFFMEQEGAYEKYMQLVAQKPALQNWLMQLGYANPAQDFTPGEWEKFLEANRVKYHLVKALKATFYSAGDPAEGGENWHIEPNGIVHDIHGKVIFTNDMLTKVNPLSGNPGHTLQMVGPGNVAVFGGTSAHNDARKRLGLAA